MGAHDRTYVKELVTVTLEESEWKTSQKNHVTPVWTSITIENITKTTIKSLKMRYRCSRSVQEPVSRAGEMQTGSMWETQRTDGKSGWPELHWDCSSPNSTTAAIDTHGERHTLPSIKRAFISAVLHTHVLLKYLIYMCYQVWPYLLGKTVGHYQRGRGQQMRPFSRFYFCVGTATLQTCYKRQRKMHPH